MAAYFATGLGTGYTGGQIDYRELKHKLDMENLDRQMKQQQAQFQNEIQLREQKRLEDQFNLEKMKYEQQPQRALLDAWLSAANLPDALKAGLKLSDPSTYDSVMQPRRIPGGMGTRDITQMPPGVMGPRLPLQPTTPFTPPATPTGMPDFAAPPAVSGGYGFSSPMFAPQPPAQPMALPVQQETYQKPDTVKQGVTPKSFELIREERMAAQAQQKAIADGVKYAQSISKGELSEPLARALWQAENPTIPWSDDYFKLGPMASSKIEQTAADIEVEKEHVQQMKQEGDIKKVALQSNIQYKNATLALSAARIGVTRQNSSLARDRERRITSQQAYQNSQRATATADKNDALIKKYQAMISGSLTALQNDLIKPGSSKNAPVYLSEADVGPQAKHHMHILRDHITTLGTEIERLQKENVVTRSHADFFLNRSMAGDGSVQPANPFKGEGGAHVVEAPQFKGKIARDVEEAFLNGVPDAKIIELGKKEHPGVNIQSILSNVKKAHKK